MYTKITIIIAILFAIILFYIAYKFNAVIDYKLAYAKDIAFYYEAAAHNFFVVGCYICLATWVWINVVVIKTKKLFWLAIPFLFTVLVALVVSYQSETLFHFNKMNGLWKGGFSLSYLVGVGTIFIAGFLLLINYVGLKKYLKSSNYNQ